MDEWQSFCYYCLIYDHYESYYRPISIVTEFLTKCFSDYSPFSFDSGKFSDFLYINIDYDLKSSKKLQRVGLLTLIRFFFSFFFLIRH